MHRFKYAEFIADIAGELEKHAAEELRHALIISKQVDYLGSMPAAEPKPVRVTKDNADMLRADLRNETETIRQYRQ
jgi:bacterioferritin